jgi:hypothetical protein
MAKKHQKAAAARARANRHKPKHISPPTEIILEPPAVETSIDEFGDLATNPIDVDWEYDCGYEGGVNRDDSETEYQPGTSSEDSESDAESLDELSGDELEWNLQQQRELLVEVSVFTRPTLYSHITNPKTTCQWAKAEKNRALGYNGQSGRSKRRKDKDARDREEFRKQARTL